MGLRTEQESEALRGLERSEENSDTRGSIQKGMTQKFHDVLE